MDAFAPLLPSAVPAASAPVTIDSKSHILIIGAGITGLTLAQALRKRNQENLSRKPITFSIYERDAHPLARGAGWGLTLHWALEQFTSIIPQYLVERLPEAYVDQDSVAQNRLGSFRLFNLQTGEDDFLTPSSTSPRNRFAREKLRRLLMDGLDIQVCPYPRRKSRYELLILFISSGPKPSLESSIQMP